MITFVEVSSLVENMQENADPENFLKGVQFQGEGSGHPLDTRMSAQVADGGGGVEG